MTYNNLLFEVNEGVATVTLNRPEAYNALTPALLQELGQVFTSISTDDSVRVVVLTGAGAKAFCSGADLKSALGDSAGEALRKNYNPLILAMRNLPKPIIARVNGVAVGAGFSLALAADFIVASSDAYFSQIFVNIGLMPDAGSTFFLPRLVGSQRAFEMAASGRKVSASEAESLGIVYKCVALEKLDEAVETLVNQYKNAPTKAIGYMKQAMNQSLYSNLDQMLELEADGQDVLSQSKDFMEGVSSFLQKRTANFKGK